VSTTRAADAPRALAERPTSASPIDAALIVDLGQPAGSGESRKLAADVRRTRFAQATRLSLILARDVQCARIAGRVTDDHGSAHAEDV
jgi:hypothetical protein